MFGCDVKDDQFDEKLELRYLCDNPVIKAGGNHNGLIYVFRGGKQWKFDNKPKDDKPFGELISGAYKAKNNWSDIHFPGGVGEYDNNFIMVYKKKWSKWKGENPIGANAGDLRDYPIGELVDEEPEMNADSGALILTDPIKNRFAKIKANQVCYLIIRNNLAKWDGKCKPLINDVNKFPPNIIAAIETSDNFWYFIDGNGTYCRRHKKDLEEVFN